MAVEHITETNRYRLHFKRIINNKRIRKSKLLPAGTTFLQAKAMDSVYQSEMLHQHSMVKAAPDWQDYVESLCRPNGWICKELQKMKYRAKKKNINFSLTETSLKKLLLQSEGRCQVTGLLFNDSRAGNRSPFFHSIDRINSAYGYSERNCRVVCYGVNVAMLSWGEEVFKDIAVGYVMNKYASFVLSQHMLSQNDAK